MSDNTPPLTPEDAAINASVGVRVRDEIDHAGITQAWIAARLHIQGGQAGLNRRLSGETPFRVHELVRIAELLGIPAAKLLQGL